MRAAPLKKSLSFFFGSVNQLLWPAVCSNCAESISESDNGLCKKCWGQLLECTAGNFCPRCGKDSGSYALTGTGCPDCQGANFHFDRIARCGVYNGAMQQMILAFKKGRTELKHFLVSLANSSFQSAPFYETVDYIIPVPLHWRRRLWRGYNQATLIAKILNHPAAQINTDLVRTRNTKSQPTCTTPAERKRNVEGAFAVRNQHPFEGKNLCLIDDIKTTGATLNECAKTLKQAGAKEVYALVLAVAGQKNK